MNKCILCNKKTNLLFTYQSYKYYKCKGCKIVSTLPYPSKNDIRKHYENEFLKGNYKFLREYSSKYNNIYLKFAKEIKSYYLNKNMVLNNKKVLDIGCFTGEFLKLMMKEGCVVYGIELQKDAVKIANKNLKGKRVVAKDVAENPFGNMKFDIITMFGVLEHVVDPKKLISNSVKKLNKNGILVIQTPNSESFFALFLKKYWPPYTPVEHIHLFSKNSLNKLLKAHDLKLVKFKNHYKVLPISYVYNMLNIFSPEFKKIIDKIPYLNLKKRNVSLPFYIGEMFIIADNK